MATDFLDMSSLTVQVAAAVATGCQTEPREYFTFVTSSIEPFNELPKPAASVSGDRLNSLALDDVELCTYELEMVSM